jgi:GT2 family glycosyltransferase
VVVLNLNHRIDLVETLESFKNQNFEDLHILVIDNASNDDSVSYLRLHYPEIPIIINEQNLGWADGNNVGIHYALGQNADFILLANNDLFFEDKHIISQLVASFDIIHNLGIIGPKENSYFNRTITLNKGWIMFPKSKFVFNKMRVRISFEYNPKDYRIVDNVSGSFMLIKNELFKDIGLMDSRLFLYAEDADFSLRAWEKGWISAIDTKLTIFHKTSATAGNNSPLKMYYKTRNLIYLIRKHKKFQENHLYFLFKYYFDFIKLSFKIILSNEFAGNRFTKLKAHFTGLLHGAIIKKMGRYY